MDIGINTYDLACNVTFHIIGNEDIKYPLEKKLIFKTQDDLFRFIMDLEKLIVDHAMEDTKAAIICKHIERLAGKEKK